MMCPAKVLATISGRGGEGMTWWVALNLVECNPTTILLWFLGGESRYWKVRLCTFRTFSALLW